MGESVFTNETFAIGAVMILIVVYFALFAFLIVSYILQSLALHTLARRRGIASPWLAWIPYGNCWIIGSLARDYDKQNNIQRRWDKTLLTLSIIFSASYFVIYIGFFVFVIISALYNNSAATSEDAIITTMFGFLIAFIPVMLLAAALQIIAYICFFKIFESTVPEKALKYFLLTLLVPLAQPICLFLCKDKGYEHPDPMAYLYAPVNKNYTYYKTDLPPVDVSDTTQTSSNEDN